MPMFGYHGRLLRVDLTERKVEVEDLGPRLFEEYGGGAGIEAKILYQETSSATDPLGPENLLMAVAGPYTGTAVPASSRHRMMARSPLTELLGESNVGGHGPSNSRRPALIALL